MKQVDKGKIYHRKKTTKLIYWVLALHQGINHSDQFHNLFVVEIDPYQPLISKAILQRCHIEYADFNIILIFEVMADVNCSK